jgi:hypothetical protein
LELPAGIEPEISSFWATSDSTVPDGTQWLRYDILIIQTTFKCNYMKTNI